MTGVGRLTWVDIGMTTEIVCFLLVFSDDGWVGISFAGGFVGTNSADDFVVGLAGDFLGVVDATFFLVIGLSGSGEVGFD
jgi:hypothetical protein